MERLVDRQIPVRTTVIPSNGELHDDPLNAGALSPALKYSILLWRHRRTLARVTAAGGLLTILITLLMPNRYESSTRLMAPDMRGGSQAAMMAGLLANAGGAASLGSSLLGGMNNAGAMLVGVLHSRTIASNLVKQYDLKKVYGVRKDDDARERLADFTDIGEDHKSGIITIAVADISPQRATNLAQSYVEQLDWLLAQVNTSSAHRERVFLEDRLKVVKQELSAAAKQLSDFSVKNTAIDPKEQGRAMVDAAVGLQADLVASQTELRGLEQVYTDSNVRVRALKARIAELRRQVEKLRGADPSQPLEAGDASDDSLNPSFRELPTLGVSYGDLYREVKLRETVFDTLTQQLEVAKIEEAKEIPSVKVLDPAEIPERKSGPSRARITVFGTLLSFALGTALILSKAAWRQTDASNPRKRFVLEIWEDVRPAWLGTWTHFQHMGSRFRRDTTANPKNGSPW